MSGALRGCSHLPAPSSCPHVGHGFLTALSLHSPWACTTGEIFIPFTSLSSPSGLSQSNIGHHHSSPVASLCAENGNCRICLCSDCSSKGHRCSLTSNRKWLLTAVEAGYLGSWYHLGQAVVRALFWVTGHQLLTVSSHRAERRELSHDSNRALILFMRAPPSYPL